MMNDHGRTLIFLNQTKLELNLKLFFRTRTEPNLESFQVTLNTFYHVHCTYLQKARYSL
jgi:hypothetical protein